jgi:hypothetical protein
MFDKKSTHGERSNMPTTLYGDNNQFLVARNTIVSMDSFVPAQEKKLSARFIPQPKNSSIEIKFEM